MTNRMRLTVSVALFLFLLSGSDVQPQVTSSISGVIQDKDGGVLPGVTVSIGKNCKCRTCSTRCDCCPAAKSIVTDSDGSFRFSGVESGEYSVKAELSGFTAVTADSVRVGAGQSVTVNLTLDHDSITVN